MAAAEVLALEERVDSVVIPAAAAAAALVLVMIPPTQVITLAGPAVLAFLAQAALDHKTITAMSVTAALPLKLQLPEKVL